MGGRTLTVGLIGLAALLAGGGLLSPTLPTSGSAAPKPSFFGEINHAPILIDGDANFTTANGVRSGSGTASKPYVIRDWGIRGDWSNSALAIRNTRAHFLVFNVTAGNDGIFGAVTLTNVSHGQLEDSSFYGGGAPNLLIESSSDITVTTSEVGDWGTTVLASDRITFTNNVIQMNLGLESSTNVSLQGNSFLHGGIRWQGSTRAHFASHSITPDNLAQGKPIRYFAGCADVAIDGSGAGQVLVADCDRVRLSNVTADDSQEAWAKDAIQMVFVRHANVSSNRVRYARSGIILDRSSDSTIVGNVFRENGVGIALRGSTGIEVFHNDLVEMNLDHVLAEDDRGAENHWSAAYPAGGNYWSRYNEPDRCTGRSQDNCTASDGIVDRPFVVDENTTDAYPLTLPFNFVDRPAVVVITVPPPPLRGDQFLRFASDGSYDPDGRFWFVGWEVDGPATIQDFGDWAYVVFRNVRTRAYNVTLAAQDDVGVRSRATVTADVLTPLSTPTARFVMRVGSEVTDFAFVGDSVTFDGSSSADAYGPIVRYSWDFMDGTRADGPVVSHAFLSPGQFTVTLFVANDRDGGSAARAAIRVMARPTFADYEHRAGFRLPVPVGWGRAEDVDVGGAVFQLLITGPSVAGHSTRIGVLTGRDPTVRETPTYLGGLADDVLASIRRDRPDVFLDGSPTYRTVSGHAAVTFVIRWPSDGIVQEATAIVSEAHERFWFLLLTVDSSFFALGHYVVETMATGFEITLAPIPPNIAGIPLSGLGIATATVLGVFVTGLLLRRWAIRSRRGTGGPLAPPGAEVIGAPLTPPPAAAPLPRMALTSTPPPTNLPTRVAGPQVRFCPRCGRAASGDNFCANCGAPLTV